MSLGATFTAAIAVQVALLFLANGTLGQEYVLTGKNSFQVKYGEVVTVTGYYKYCLGSVYCPSCLRQIYLNLFDISKCLASIGKSQFDCKETHFSKTFIAPDVAGIYYIRMEEKLEYKCMANRKSDNGLFLGTVRVQGSPSIVKSPSSPVEAVVGDSLTLKCSASGYPPPAVRWYKDSTLLHNDTSLQFPSLKQSDAGLYTCNASNIYGSDTRAMEVLVRERGPEIKQTISTFDADDLLQNDTVKFTVVLSHGIFSRDTAFNTILVWTLPHYTSFLNHVPKTNVSNPYPGEYNIQIGQIQLGSSMKINITVQIDPDCTLSVGQHFLSVPSFIMYEQRMTNNATKMFVGAVEAATVNFTVREDIQRGFLMNPLSDEVYFCKEKKSDSDPSCYLSNDGVQWIGLDSRVKMISGMIATGLSKRIFGVTRNNRCHVVSRDGLIWNCIMPEEWQRESSSKDFVRAISVPRNLSSHLPESKYVASKTDGTVSYGGSAKGLHRKRKSGVWSLVASWDCP